MRSKSLINPIENYVNSFFEGIHYSKETEEAKEKIINKLNDEYSKELKDNPRYAFQNIIEKYPSLEDMAESIGINKNNIDRWFNKEITMAYDEFEAKFKKTRKNLYIISILTIISVMYIITALLYNNLFIYLIILAGIFIIVDIVFVIKHKKESPKELLSVDSQQKIEDLFDKYVKKCLVCLFIFFIGLFGISFNLISVSINSREFELITEITKNLYIIEIIAFFSLKNALILRWLNKKIEFENYSIYKKAIRKLFFYSFIYFVISLGIYYGFEKVFVFNPILPILGLYLFYALIFYFIKSKKFTYNKKGINKLVLIPVVVCLTVFGLYELLSRDIWLTQPLINSTPYIYEGNDQITYDDKTGIYTIISNEDDFKILQLTDIHLGGGVISYDKDKKALEAVFKLIDYAKPDLVVVTGDLTYPLGLSSFSFNNTAPVAQFAAFMRNTGVPWVFTYGNHDTESMAAGNKEDLNELYKSLSWKTSRNLLYPYVQPTINGEKITGRNNQLIEVRNSDGTLNQALFLIDSNAYVGKGFSKYDYIRDEQVEWYKKEILRLNNEEGKTISSLGFFHIPLKEYKTAYDLYMNNSKEVKYFFGSNEEKTEKKVSASEYPSSLFNVARELGSTKGFFCGHDHYNNMSLEYKGIRLTYGMSIDYLVEPGIARDTKQRGATLIISHRDSSIDIKQIPLTLVER